MTNEDKYITLVGEDDTEVLAEVVFTFENDGENYVLLTLTTEFDEVEDLEDEYNVLAYKYEELEDGSIGNLIEISETADEEWALVEEMLATFEETNFEMEN
ncbi:DUF1292 domain-containing protein [Mollicutes bacterium LVI A0078]|nr:DUF1292 domain-containing protein [Mollicutes bacterium LVI A0075]WOO91101.1 DUF1292 domain-containing protein [Mollicutes bacterium LVI A0078]